MMERLSKMRWLPTAVMGMAIAIPIKLERASAEQKVLFDTGIVTLPDKEKFFCDSWTWNTAYQTVIKLPHFNWLHPINYAEGRIHIRFEVIKRPGTKQFLALNMLQEPGIGGDHWFNPTNKPLVTTPGVYTADFAVDLIRDAKGLKKRWDNPPPLRAVFLVKNGRSGGSPNASWDDPAFYPMTVRFSWVLVSKDGAFQRPGIYAGLDPEKLTHLRSVTPLLQGERLGAALRLAERRGQSKDEALAREARLVVRALKKHAENRRDELAQLKSDVPLYAVTKLDELARQYLPTPLGKRLAAEAKDWSREPHIIQARKAQLILDIVERAAAKLKKQMSRKRTLADLRRSPKYRQLLQRVGMGAVKLRRAFPHTSAASRATQLAGDFEIELPKNRTPVTRSSARQSMVR